MEQLINMTLKEGIFACLFVWLLLTILKNWNEMRGQMTKQIEEQWICIQKQNDIIEKQTEQLNEQNKKIDDLTEAVRELSDTVKFIVGKSNNNC